MCKDFEQYVSRCLTRRKVKYGRQTQLSEDKIFEHTTQLFIQHSLKNQVFFILDFLKEKLSLLEKSHKAIRKKPSFFSCNKYLSLEMPPCEHLLNECKGPLGKNVHQAEDDPIVPPFPIRALFL